MLIADVIAALERLAPPSLAADWDNVGLLAGSRDGAANKILLTIDFTEAVAREAIDAGGSMIVAYHPPIFQPLRSITDSTAQGRALLSALRENIAIYTPHTALDAAEGGLNDWLATGVSGASGDVRAIEPFAALPISEQRKIITFCPAEAVETVRNGLASVGAGRIGAYTLCSFEVPGTGTFLPSSQSNPAVGRKGELNRVNEVRLEMVCPVAALALAVTALREFHPYEEPPIEIIRLEPRPQRAVGHGRRIVLDQGVSLRTLVERVKSLLGVRQVQVATAVGAMPKVTHIGVCAGAGSSLLDSAIAQGCQAFITGEMRHHDVLAAQSRGCSVILAGHTNTERPYLKVLAKRLRDELDDVTIVISRKDVDPLKTM